MGSESLLVLRSDVRDRINQCSQSLQWLTSTAAVSLAKYRQDQSCLGSRRGHQRRSQTSLGSKAVASVDLGHSRVIAAA